MSDLPKNPYDQPPGDLLFSPEEPPKKQRGCFFYGCLTLIVLAVIGMILFGIAAYLAYSWLDKGVKEYTSTTPMVLPQVNLPEEERKALNDRWKTFKEAVDKGEAAELTLTSDEVNALIHEQPDLKGKVYISIKDDKISGQLSLPMDWLPILGKGRFFNGSATLTVSLHDGNLVVHAKEFEANGKKPPADFMEQFARQNLAKDVANDPKNAEMLSRFDNIEIKDSKIYLKAHSRSEKESESARGKATSTSDEEKPTTKEGDEPKAEEKAKDKDKTPDEEKEKDKDAEKDRDVVNKAA